MKERHQDFIKRVIDFNTSHSTAVPSMLETREFTGNLIHTLFPIKRNLVAQEAKISLEMDRCAIKLKELLYSIRNSLDQSPESLVDLFFSQVPDAFEQMMLCLGDRCLPDIRHSRWNHLVLIAPQKMYGWQVSRWSWQVSHIRVAIEQRLQGGFRQFH